jgi:hypothetical protein
MFNSVEVSCKWVMAWFETATEPLSSQAGRAGFYVTVFDMEFAMNDATIAAGCWRVHGNLGPGRFLAIRNTWVDDTIFGEGFPALRGANFGRPVSGHAMSTIENEAF